MSTSVHQLETVTTRGRTPSGASAANAGSTGLTLTPSQIERLPIDGSDLAYNQDDPLLPDILVCRPVIAGLLLNAIREATHAI